MKLRLPEYYKEFHCIADKCKEDCCSAGWEIDIDKKTAKFYSKISGEFGERLRKNIDFNKTPHFILEKNRKCPFLNDKKLCDIYINLGSDSLCQICREHPRYYEWFDDIKEGGIGLCCEEASRIVLSYDKPFSTYEIDIPFESVDEYNKELYSFLFNARSKIISYLENSSIPFNSRIRNVIGYGYSIQQMIWDKKIKTLDLELINVETNESVSRNMALKPILNFLLNLESCNDDWIPYLKKCISLCEQSNDRMNDFECTHPEVTKYLKNISICFIWRYFLKATFDEDVLSKVGLMAISVAVIRYLFFAQWLENGDISFETCIHWAKRFSEEIEYSDDNLIALADACYELQDFSLEHLIGLFI